MNTREPIQGIPIEPLKRAPPHPAHLIAFWCFGAIFGMAIVYKPPTPAPRVDTSSLVAELDKIRDSIVQLQASKCVNVTTQGVTIYHTPNLGVAPVPTYDKPVRKGKSDVREVRQAPGGPEGSAGGG